MYITAKGQLDSLKQRLLQLEQLEWSPNLVSGVFNIQTLRCLNVLNASKSEETAQL